MILTNEKDPTRLNKMRELGWLLMPCLAAKCPQSERGGGREGGDENGKAIQDKDNELFLTNDLPISGLDQLVAEIAVACESTKSILNMASTFLSIIKRLHHKGEAGVEMLRNV